MRPIKLDKDIAKPFSEEVVVLREKGEHAEAFELMDNLSEQAASSTTTKSTDNSDSNSDTED
jgi:hypothetical protein